MTKAAETIVRMLETLPEKTQEHVVDTVAMLVEEARDDAKWDDLFALKADGLAAAARRAREEIAQGKATPMNYDEL